MAFFHQQCLVFHYTRHSQHLEVSKMKVAVFCLLTIVKFKVILKNDLEMNVKQNERKVSIGDSHV